MKKFTTLFLCLIVSLGINAQENKETKGVVFSHGTLAESLAKAKANKKGPKLVFLDCYTSWCGPCKYMANTVFPMEIAGKFFNANFVNIKIDMEKGEGVDIAKKYAVKAYPTFLILDAEGNEVNRVVGGGEAEEFIKKIQNAMDVNNSPKAKKAAYDANKSIENAIAYMEVLSSSYMEKEQNDFFAEIFPGLSTEDRYSDKMWQYLSPMLGNPDSKIFQIVLDEKNIADENLTKEKVDGTICYGLKGYAFGYVTGRMQNPDKAAIMNKVSYLNLLSNKDESAPYFVKVAKLYSEDKIEEIAALLDLKVLMRFSESDRGMVEKLILSVKGLSKEKKAEYIKAKIDYFNAQAKSNEEYYQKLTASK